MGEVYKYEAPWNVFALDWSHRPQSCWRLALGSFIEEYRNKLQVIELDQERQAFVKVAEQDHAYPMTKVQWMPHKNGDGPELLATTGDFLRVWQFHDATDATASTPDGSRLERKAVLANNKTQDFCAPLTSFDWNETDPSILGTCSIDTTCTIWDINTGQVKTQLIAHDKEVYDMGFTTGTDIFASVGGDGSVRMFDVRNLEHSTIIYETADGAPLLRLAWNKQDPNYLATFQLDSPKVAVLDIRVPSIPVTELHGHVGAINGCSWAPHSSGHMCTVGDDAQALVWDLSQMKKYIQDPILSYTASSEINQISWSRTQTDWVAIAHGNTVESLRI